MSFGKLLREQPETEEAPRQVDVGREEQGGLACGRELADAEDERVDAPAELRAPVVRIEIGGERLDGPVVHLEVAVRVSPGCDEQERTASRAVQLRLVDLDGLPGDVREHRQRIAQLPGVDAREQLSQGVHHYHEPRQMDDVLAKAEEWRAAGEDVAIATVVATRRSAPRPLGSKLAVTRSGRMFGSVSGGCVEADVAERCQAVLDGEVASVVSYGIEDEQAWTVGLPCGGEIDVFLEPFAGSPTLARGTSYVVVEGDGVGERWEADEPARTGLREEAGRSVFVEAIGPPPRLVAVGAGDIAEALCALARPLGWRTVVVDPRAGLATRERVPSADEVIVAWPDEIEVDAGTALVSLVHEERIDLPALRRGVEGGAFYVGALGSKRTQAKRAEQLGEVAEQVRGPVGLNLGGETPAEIALEIIAEVLAVHRTGDSPKS